MNITDIRIRRTYCENRLRALVSITIDHDLALHDIKIIQGAGPPVCRYAQQADENGEFQGHLPSHHATGKTAAGAGGAGLLPTVSATAGSCRLKSATSERSGWLIFILNEAPCCRVENRSRVAVIAYLFLPLRSVRPPASDTTASAAITALRSCAPVSGLPLSAPLR